MRPLIIIALLALPAWAAQADYSSHPKASTLLDTLRDSHGFSADQLDNVRAALRSAERIDKLIKREQTAPERTWTWYDYRPIHVNQANVERGRQFMAEHRDTFDAAEKRWGVPAEVIAAILGAETKFGSYTGPHRILDSLATQGFDHPTRSRFFFSELVEFFALCRDRDMDPLQPKGSYAGAMGLSQFMPSNYRSLAVDFDENGNTDLWTPADAIGSAANYLVNYRGPGRGWQRGKIAVVQPMDAEPVQLSEQVKTNTRKAPYTIGDLAGFQLRPSLPLPDEAEAGIIELEVADGVRAQWIGLNNFYVLMSYNPRTFYAMAVHDLSQALAE